jgi:hypothetical protein
MLRRLLVGRWLVAGGLALLLSGCLPESVNPLTPPEQALDAPEILGLWQATVEGAPLYVHVLRGDKSPLEVVVVGHEPDGSGSTELYVGHVSEIDGRRYLNLQTVEAPADTPAPFWFLRYDRDREGRVTVRFLSTEKLASAIAEGTLAGTVEGNGLVKSVRLTGAPLEIASFLAAADPAGLFDREFTFERLR